MRTCAFDIFRARQLNSLEQHAHDSRARVSYHRAAIYMHHASVGKCQSIVRMGRHAIYYAARRYDAIKMRLAVHVVNELFSFTLQSLPTQTPPPPAPNTKKIRTHFALMGTSIRITLVDSTAQPSWPGRTVQQRAVFKAMTRGVPVAGAASIYHVQVSFVSVLVKPRCDASICTMQFELEHSPTSARE